MKVFAPLCYAVAFMVLGSMFYACTDPFDVGAELLDDDRAEVGYTDTFEVKATTVVADSLLIYAAGGSILSYYLLGNMADAYFGEAEAGIYLEPLLLRDLNLNSGSYSTIIELFRSNPVVMDSVILVLPLDSTNSYGDLTQPFSVEVYEINERFDATPDENGIELFYSDLSFDVKPTRLANHTFVPNFDTAFVTKLPVRQSSDTIIQSRHARIPLDKDYFLQRFFDVMAVPDTTFQNDSLFLEFFKGLYVKPAGPTPSYLGINLSTGWAGMYFYYTIRDSSYQYAFPLNSVGRRTSTYRHNYENSLVGQYLNDTGTDDSLLFVQGMRGLMAEIDLSDLKNLTNAAINKAELSFQVATLPGYNQTLHPPLPQLTMMYRDSDGELVQITDIEVSGSDLSAFFGGQPAVENGVTIYNVNVSIHAQYLKDGTMPEKMYLLARPRTSNPGRVILLGNKAGNKRVEVRVSYTKL